ncbi:MAG: hypothetical protein VSS75_022015, partial [Candidatus Parabeggiatoa sp.]|nr:hypothetical protein [Candidatus Parabeggiatoa sp.]
DSASLNLLETLMTDTEGHYFLIIGAYRDNEVDAAHPLMIRLKDLKKAQVTVKTISLPNLSYDDVNTLTADALGTEPSDALAFMVYEKTQGNSFFTHEFLKSLYQQKLLFFDFQKRQWDWDLTQIKAQNITDNVIDLMVAKFQKLNEKTQNILKLAACIGNQFEIDTLAIVCEQNVSKTKADLWEALTEELVLPLEESYKFVHDRIQQTVYSLIQTEQKQAVHWQVGQLLLKNTSPERREQSIFAIVDQLDAGIELATEQSERYEIAQLNLIAGQKAKSSTAYQPAFNYLSVGIKLLGKMGWQTQYDLILALHVEAAEAAYLSNHFEPMEQLVEVVLQQANTLLDKVQAYEIKILSYMAQNRMLDAIKIGLQVLKLLGVSLPNKPNTLHIILSLLQTKFIVGRKRIDDLVNLPEMSHPDRLAAMRILARITSAAYIATPKLFPLIVFKQVNLSIKQGNTTGSAYAYATYGLVLCHVVGDIKTGYQFGQLALTLLEKSQIKEIRAKTLFVVNNLIRHWKEHAKELLKPLLDAYQSGLETGDLEFANYAVVNYPLNSYLIGRELTEIEQESNKYNNIISQLKQESGIHMHYIFRQVILNVIKPIENPGTLMGEEFDEEKMLPVYLESNNVNALCYLYCNKLTLCYLFHAYPKAVENATLAEKYLEGMVGFMFVPIFHFYDSLARIAMFHEVQKPEQKNIFKKIATNQKKMKQWAHHAPMNHLHKFYLVEAERCRVLGKDGEAREFYDKAIAKAHETEYLN